MKNILAVLFIAVIFFAFGCTPSDSAKNPKERTLIEDNYIPPADGKIKEEQVEKYIKTAMEMSNELLLISEKMMSFKAKHGIKDDTEMENLESTKPAAKKEFDAIISEWEKKERDIYIKNKMTPSEFEWIAAGLTDPVNSEIQKKVEKALSGE